MDAFLAALFADEDSLFAGGSLVVIFIIVAIILLVWRPWKRDGE